MNVRYYFVWGHISLGGDGMTSKSFVEKNLVSMLMNVIPTYK